MKTKQRLFLESGRIVSQKMFFWFSLRNWVFLVQKPSFSSETLTRRRNCSQRRVCISFVVCARYELVLPTRFECHYYWDSVPLSINTIQVVVAALAIAAAVAAVAKRIKTNDNCNESCPGGSSSNSSSSSSSSSSTSSSCSKNEYQWE